MTMARVSASLRLAPPLLLLVVILQLLSQSAVAVKPGTCPRQRPGSLGVCLDGGCTDDESCPGDQKCCRNRCGGTCRDPIPDIRAKPGSCPAVTFTGGACPKIGNLCERDMTCPDDKKCCFNGCYKYCKKPLYRKPGLCPHVDSSVLICPRIANLDTCQKDWECQGQDKCCSTGCAKICQKPVKVGACPVSEFEYYILNLKNCSRDSDCDGNKKCCSLSYGARCVEPDPCSMVKEGSCPIEDYSRIRCFRYQHDCGCDADCPNNDKCCRVACGAGCVDPDTVKNDKEPL